MGRRQEQGLCVGVIGLGYFAGFHLRAWLNDPRVDRVVATDIDPAKRRAAAEIAGVEVFDDLALMLAGPNPEIVDIVAPPTTHGELISATLARGRVVICQKPFCTSYAEAELMADLADAVGGTLLVHENFRFQPWYRTLHHILSRGQVGSVFQARFALRPGDGRGRDAYLARQPAFRRMERLLIHETGVHFVDLFGWLFGPVTAIYADIRRLNPIIKGEDAGWMLLDHSTGTRSVFDGNRLSDHATDNPRRTMGEMQIDAEGGTLTLDGQGRLFLRLFGHGNSEQIPLIADMDEASFGGGCVAALCAHVTAAFAGQGAFENSAREYLPVIRASEAAYLSAQEGRKINLPTEG